MESNGPIYARLVNDLYQVVCLATGNVSNIDKDVPEEAVMVLSATEAGTDTNVTADVTQSDKQSGVEIGKCKWVYNTNPNPIGIEEESYIGTFTQETETISLKPKGAGTYYLHILTIDKAGNKRESISEESVTITYDPNAESLIRGVENISSAGNYQIIVSGITYNVHVEYYEGDQVWTTNKVFGESTYLGQANSDASKMSVVKIDGDLTIKSGVTVQVNHNSYGGPKGLFIYCTGKIELEGQISNNYGAKHPGENVYLWKNDNGSYETVSANGANGAAAVSASGSQLVGRNGNAGNAANNRLLGGGAGGAVASGWLFDGGSGVINGSKGGNATSYSGGAGGGGTTRNSNSVPVTPNHAWLYAGSNAAVVDGSWYAHRSAAGGGAGAVAGIGVKSKDAIRADAGGTGSGGLLIICSEKLVLKQGSKITASGAKGGDAIGTQETGNGHSAAAGGGGSGGGSINIFTNDIETAQGDSIATFLNVNGGRRRNS